MFDFDPTNLTDEELARACDTYIQRAIRRIHDAGVSDKVLVFISACAYKSDNSYDITHKLEVGPYNEEIKISSNNLISSAARAIERWHEDRNLPPPTKVQPLLAPPPPPAEPYAEFEEVPPADDDDPF